MLDEEWISQVGLAFPWFGQCFQLLECFETVSWVTRMFFQAWWKYAVYTIPRFFVAVLVGCG